MRDWMIVPGFAGLRQSHTPGRCVKCGTSDQKRRVLSSGIVLSEGVAPGLRGDIQFCDECIKAAARLLDMIDPVRAEDLRVSARDANLAKGRLERRVNKLETLNAALMAAKDSDD